MKRNKKSNRNSKRETKETAVLKRIEQNTRLVLDKAPPNVVDKIPMKLSNKTVYTFKRSTIGTGISVSTSSSTFGAASYYLASFDSTSEIAENYQLYRIIELTVKFIPVGNFVNSIDETNDAIQDMGHFHTAIDQHNDSTPISMAELEEYKTHQVVRTGQYIARTFTPRTLGRVFAGVTDGYYAMSPYVWLSTDYNDVNYYGVKWALSQVVGVTNGSTIYTTQIDAVIQCKNSL